MFNIKKYANGRFFDTATKEYIKPEKLAELIKKGEKIQVTLTKTGKDITDTVIEQFSKKEDKKKEIPFLKTEKLVKWIGEVIDSKIEKVMEVVKLPTREQVANLDENIKALNKKIDALKLSQEKSTKKKTAAPKKTTATPKIKAVKETPDAKKTPAAKKTTPADKEPVAAKLDTENKTETKLI